MAAYALTYLGGGENLSPRPVAMKISTTPPQRIAPTRKQLDTSQLHSHALHLRATDREHPAKVCVLAPHETNVIEKDADTNNNCLS